MRISYTTLATPELNGIEAIKIARKYGYDGIDLRVSASSGELTLTSSKQHIQELVDTLDTEGIALASLLAYNATGGLSPSTWVRMADSILTHLELAGTMNASTLRIGLGKIPAEMEETAYQDRLVNLLHKVLSDAPNHVSLLIQNHYNNFNVRECSHIIRQLCDPRLGLIVSSDHCLLQNEGAETVQQSASGITKQLYIADILKLENSYEDVLPGTGEIPIQQYLDAIGGTDFQGWVTFKWEKFWRPYLVDYERSLPFFINYVRSQLEISSHQ